MITSMTFANLSVKKPPSATNRSNTSAVAVRDEMDTSKVDSESKFYLIVGTAYALHDEDEPTKGRVMVFLCSLEDDNDPNKRSVKLITELQVRGGVYSMCQYYDGKILVTVNSKTEMCQLIDEGTGILKLSTVGIGHHGHILSLFVSSRAPKPNRRQVGGQPLLKTMDRSDSVDVKEKKPVKSNLQLSAI